MDTWSVKTRILIFLKYLSKEVWVFLGPLLKDASFKSFILNYYFMTFLEMHVVTI